MQLLPILELLAPPRKGGGGRNKENRNRRQLWRKLKKLSTRIQNTTSVAKATRLLRSKHDLEAQLKSLYENMSEATEAKVIAGMKVDTKVFFDYAKSRQKTKAKVGPFLDPDSGELLLDPEHTAQKLSEQYSSVFTKPHPE